MSNAMKVKQVIFVHCVCGKTDELIIFFFSFPTISISTYNEVFIPQVLFTYFPVKQLHMP